MSRSSLGSAKPRERIRFDVNTQRTPRWLAQHHLLIALARLFQAQIAL